MVALLFFLPMLLGLVLQKGLLLICGQNPEVVELANKYILMMTPTMLIMGQVDLQRKFLIQMGKSHLQMNTQIYITLIHVTLTWLLVGYLEYNLTGIALSSFLTNLSAWMINEHYINSEDDLNEALKVPMNDEKVR